MTSTYVRIKRIAVAGLFALATVLTQFAVVLPASAATLTWTGTAGDGKFGTGGNWNTGNAPVNNDILTFSVASLSANATLDNDISNLSVAGINFIGSNASYRKITITGNALTLTGNVANTSTTSGSPISHSLNTNLVIGAPVTVNDVDLGGSAINTQTNALSFTGQAGCGAGVSAAVSGSGAINANTQYGLHLNGNSTTYSGVITSTAGTIYAIIPSLGTAAGGTVASGSGSIVIIAPADASTAEPLTLGGSGKLSSTPNTSAGCSGGGAPVTKNLTLTGAVTLQSNFVYGGDNNAIITGTYNDNSHNFSVESGSVGTLTTPQGEVEVPTETITLSGDQPSQTVNVLNKQIAILEGTRGDINVSYGGILKGTGTANRISLDDGGIVAPGNSPGKLTVIDQYSSSSTSKLQIEIQNTTNYDQLAVGSGFTGTGNSNAVSLQGELQVSLYEGWKIKQGDTFRIVDNLSATAVSGVFTGLAEGTQFTVNGIVFSISYVGGDGNDVIITALNAGNDPAAPNTGALRQALANPLVVLALGITTAALLAGIALRRRTQR